jgi:hypothetical protein
MSNEPKEKDNAVAVSRTKDLESASDSELVAELLERIEEDPEREVKHVLETSLHSFRGPIPPPSVLAGYNEVEPGFAERIVAMAEKEQSHRHDQENKALNQEETALKGSLHNRPRGAWRKRQKRATRIKRRNGIKTLIVPRHPDPRPCSALSIDPVETRPAPLTKRPHRR